MDFVISLLRPIFLPLLKLSLTPPHLPEGTALVREQKPGREWLTWRYLTTLLGLSGQLFAVVVAVIALASTGPLGVAGASVLLLLEGAVMSFTLVAVRVDWELRHYLIGNKSLRVVHGALTREETTISYANIQNIEVTQGPLERVLGFKNLTISTAGASNVAQGQLAHAVVLAGLPDADELRALILEMIKAQKDTGLGDAAPVTPAAGGLGFSPKVLEEVAAAARALRDAARARSSPKDPA
jgi:membrane protein YdbS with pleckstrin-like domain